MSQCVPGWELDENPTPSRLTLRSHSNNSTVPDVPMLDYEVAELTWENGQLAMHGLGPPRGVAAGASAKPFPASTTPPSSKPTWGDKPRACGTLESIVNQATHRVKPLLTSPYGGATAIDELVTWFDEQRVAAVAAAGCGGMAATLTMDALVPCSNRPRAAAGTEEERASSANNNNNRVMRADEMDCSARVGSCSGRGVAVENGRRKVARAEWSGKEHNSHSASGSATFGRDSRHVTLDTCERDLGLGGFTSTTSFGSHEDYTSSGKPGTNNKTSTADENDSACHSHPQRGGGGGDEEKKKGNGKSSVSTKRSRAAAIHNQSERKRRDKINQRMKTLQKLVPNSSKSDKASMLDEVIEYLKQLQAQVQMMNRMNMHPMILPMAMQQQLQMSMMTPMGMGMRLGMGMGMLDMNSIGRPNMAAGIPPVLHPTAFIPGMSSWDPGASSGADRMQSCAPAALDPLSAFLACQSQQPMTMDAYNRIAALYQQLQKQQRPGGASSKN